MLSGSTRVPAAKPVRYGLTVIELLVSIAVIAILIAIVVPAVQYVRESSRRMQCVSNLRQIAIAMHQYHDTRNALPPGKLSDHAGNRMQHAFWAVHILPYVEKKPLFDEIQAMYSIQPDAFQPAIHATARTPVEVYACASDGRVPGPQQTHKERVVALTSYVGCLGINHERKNGLLYLDSHVNFSAISDGTSHTILIGERPPSTDFWYGWWHVGYGQEGSGSPDALLGAEEVNTSADMLEGCGMGPHYFKLGRISEMCDTLHFWSHHPGGASFAFADGSVHMITYDASEVLSQLATRAGSEVISVP